MLRKMYGLMVIALAALICSMPSGVQAQEIGEGLREACSRDVENFCSQVTRGEGRLVACFYAHNDQLSAPCDMAIVETGDKLAAAADKLRTAVAICARDIREHCSSVDAGSGRIFRCLSDNKASLNEGCGKVVGRIQTRMTSR